MRDMSSCFSIGDRLSLIVMRFGLLDHPHRLESPSSVGGFVVLNTSPIKDQVVEPKDQCRMAQCLHLSSSN